MILPVLPLAETNWTVGKKTNKTKHGMTEKSSPSKSRRLSTPVRKRGHPMQVRPRCDQPGSLHSGYHAFTHISPCQSARLKCLKHLHQAIALD